jgi:hypothetical protein
MTTRRELLAQMLAPKTRRQQIWNRAENRPSYVVPRNGRGSFQSPLPKPPIRESWWSKRRAKLPILNLVGMDVQGPFKSRTNMVGANMGLPIPRSPVRRSPPKARGTPYSTPTGTPSRYSTPTGTPSPTGKNSLQRKPTRKSPASRKSRASKLLKMVTMMLAMAPVSRNAHTRRPGTALVAVPHTHKTHMINPLALRSLVVKNTVYGSRKLHRKFGPTKRSPWAKPWGKLLALRE